MPNQNMGASPDQRHVGRIREHMGAAEIDVHELVRQLNTHLGPTLVAAMANVRDWTLPTAWAEAGGPVPSEDSEARLRKAYDVWLHISAAEDDDVARTWFVGANPILGDQSPVMRLRDGALASVTAAAAAFVEGTDS